MLRGCLATLKAECGWGIPGAARILPPPPPQQCGVEVGEALLRLFCLERTRPVPIC